MTWEATYPRRSKYCPGIGGDEDPGRDLGGPPNWFWGVPDTLRALSSSRAGAVVPAAPRAGDNQAQRLGYWTALHYVLLRRLGWTRPDRGLRWWYDNGKPTEDETLRFVFDVWDADSHGLDEYLGWLLEGRPRFQLHAPDIAWAHWDDEQPPLGEAWTVWNREVHDRAARSTDYVFGLGEGWDPLHLSGQIGSGRRDTDAYLLHRSPNSQRAVLVASRMDSWYAELLARGESLAGPGNTSLRVDVFVKPVGFIGTYRRSSATGLWFTGRHLHHSVGQ
jgi:hypothetical protein